MTAPRDAAAGPARPPRGTAFRFALRDLRGGLGSFRIMLACLALGVAAIAAIGSFVGGVRDGLARDARVLNGGDLDIRLTHRPATEAQLAWLRARAEVSAVKRMRTMAAPVGGARPGARARTLIELKAVDGAYPLFGEVALTPPGPLARALARRDDGTYGAAAARGLFVRLGLEPGDRLRVGEATFVLTAELADEPDKGSGMIRFGPRVMVSLEALAATGLLRPGSLVRHHYRVRYPPGTDGAAFEAALAGAFPDAGWRVRNLREAAPRLRRVLDRLALFFTLIGLTALLVGGIGVAGAVRAYLDGKRETIATLKALGAPGRFVFAVFALEVALTAALGILIGLAAGALAPALGGPGFAARLPVEAAFGLQPGALALAAAYGAGVTVLFTLWPLARAREIPPAALFRGLVAEARAWPRPAYLAGMGAAALGLAALAYATADRPRFALWFIGGAVGAFTLFHLLGAALKWLAGRATRALTGRGLAWPRLNLALAGIHRPGAPAAAIVVSFGVGLTVFTALALIEGNFQRQLAGRIPAAAPAYFFLDIQPGQVAEFEETVRAVPGAGRIERTPALRGRIVRIDGRPVAEAGIAPDVRWAVRGDRGVTYAGARHAGTELAAGRWWPADYAGPPLLSIDHRLADGFGIGPGDTLTLNILGREITAEIANTRRIDWAGLGLNFTMMLSPGVLEGAPHTFIATVHAPPAVEEELARAVTARFDNVTAIRVREALDAVAGVLRSVGGAARATAALALAAGVLVLAGAIAAGRRQRTRDAVILKVTGARRRDLLAAYLIEYGIAGTAAAALAAGLGTVAAFFVLTRIMDQGWAFLPGPVAGIAAAAAAVVIVLGFAGTWRALARRPAPVLREGEV